MPRGRPRKTTSEFDESKAVRLTFRLDEDTVAMFKTIAAIKRMKLEELGKEAVHDLIKKYVPLLKNLQSQID
jgi:tartrate dehydratase beta subunit/fumarate hydratase class I family protein